jgi:beta-glucosidase
VPNTPQYPFGYGLSYTTFDVGTPHLSSGSVSPHGQLRVTVPVSNTGSADGADVIQLYLHQDDTSLLQPVRKLEGFERVSLPAGKSTTVTFTLSRQNFGFYNDQGQFVIEPGQFHMWVGDSSVGGTDTPFNVG